MIHPKARNDAPPELNAAAENLRGKAREMGLVLSVWDASGHCIDVPEEGGSFCRMTSSCGKQCSREQFELARCVADSEEPQRQTGSMGCCLIGLPVRRRRRVVGVVILGYPTREMADEEHLARLCDRLGLDREVMAGYADANCRHAASEAPHLQQLFTWLLDQGQEAHEADEALTSLSVNLASTYEELSLLYRISGSMKVSQRPRPFLQDVCDQLVAVMDTQAAAAVVYDVRTQMGGDIVVRAGDGLIDPQRLRLLAATRIAPHLVGEDALLLQNSYDGDDDGIFGRDLQNLLAVPLMVERQCIGVLIALNKTEGDFDSSDSKLIRSIANQTSVFLANHRMYAELQELLMGVLHSLTESIDAKDPYTCGHSRRVAAISRKLAEAYGFDQERIQHIHLSGLLHDVGKIGVPEAILCKNGRLTDEEYEIIKRHPAMGAKILRRIRHLQPIISGVLNHHERPDGRGYPNGLYGSQVPIEGLIVGLADSWDAMTSHRTYRRGLTLDRAIEEVRTWAGKQFDAHLAEILLSWDLPAFMEELHASNVTDLHLLDERLY